MSLVIILWAATIGCFALIILVARRLHKVDDLDAETVALWAEACPWPVEDESGFHNETAIIP